MKDEDPLVASVRDLAKSILTLNRQAEQTYTPIVEEILQSRNRDVRQIEHTLDGLLDFCGHDPALQLYSRLCRHYSGIDPAAAADYRKAYRERWADKPQSTAVAGLEWKKSAARKPRTVKKARIQAARAAAKKASQL
jgi:hypothetical protein